MRFNPLQLLIIVSLALLAGLVWLLPSPHTKVRIDTSGAASELLMYCAAGMRAPVERIATEYQEQYGIRVQIQYGGSNTLLNQYDVSRIGDLFLSADDSYLELARQKGLVREILPAARMRAVIGVPRGKRQDINSIESLLRNDVRLALGNPDQAAIGSVVRRELQKAAMWTDLEDLVRRQGVFKPTVGDVANDIKLESADAGILWDAVANQYPDIEIIEVPQLENAVANISVGILSSSKHPTAALRFARFLTGRDRGLQVFRQMGYKPVDGDVWQETPQLTFFAGAVNRRAVEPIVHAFAQREGVEVDTVYNGCGILTSQMKTIADGGSGSFPDAYMACDKNYLENVKELFQDAVTLSSTPIVIVVAKGNPKGITRLRDLQREGIRVALGQPEQCTIGILSRRLLESVGIYDTVLRENVVTQTSTSSLLIPSITTGSADVTLAYLSDTQAEHDKLDVVSIDSPLAQAVQPFGIARSSKYKHLGRRLLDAIVASRDQFEAAGLEWQYSK